MRRDYLSRLSRAARWYLPPAEAAEVLEDYREIVAGRSEEELRRDLGTPRAAIKQLAQPKIYRKWLAVFGVLAACLALPMAMARNEIYWSPVINTAYMIFLSLGGALSLNCFRRNRNQGKRLPRGIVPLLALLLAGMAGVWFLVGLVLTESWELLNWLASAAGLGWTIHLLLRLMILAMALIALCALVKSRLDDSRWCAVYILGLSGVILGLSFYLLMTSMNFDGFVPGWWRPHVIQYIVITLLGLLETGVSLC